MPPIVCGASAQRSQTIVQAPGHPFLLSFFLFLFSFFFLFATDDLSGSLFLTLAPKYCVSHQLPCKRESVNTCKSL